jgi:hypothetical protein
MARFLDLAQGVIPADIGLRLGRERQGIGRVHNWRVDRLAVDQPMQQVQDVRLGRRACLERQFHGGKHDLLVMVENKSQNLDHLSIAARRLEHALLEDSEGGRQFGDRSAIAQGAGFSLNGREIVARPRTAIMLAGVVTLSKRRREAGALCGTSSGRDDLAPRGHRRGAEHAVGLS